MLGLDLPFLKYLVIFLVSFLVLRFLYNWLVAPRFSILQKIPGIDRGNIIFGNVREIFGGEAIDPYVRWMQKLNTGFYRYAHILLTPRVVVADAEAMKYIMVTNVKNYPKPTFLFSLFSRVVGDSLLTLNGEAHLTQRRLCMEAFKFGVLKRMIPSFQKHGAALCEMWRASLAEDSQAQLPVRDHLHRMAMDAICECAFGYSANALHDPDQPEAQAFFYVLGGFKPSFLRLLAPKLEGMLPVESNLKLRKNLDMSEKLIKRVINNKTSAMAEEKGGGGGEGRDLLSMLLEARDTESGQGLSDRQLRDHVMTFMLAGHETTSTSLCWVLLQLANMPELQAQLREEVERVLPPQGQPVTAEHLEDLKLLTAVIKETMRLYPPASLTFRMALQDDVVNGYKIPAGTIFNINIGALHRNPEYWTNPEEFDPTRFFDESAIKPYTYLPFIAGPRMCIGYKFAMLEMKVVLALLMQNFTFQPIPGQTYKKRQRITLKPDPDLMLHAKYVGGQHISSSSSSKVE